MAFQATSWKRSGTVEIARAVAGSTSSKPRRRQRHSRARWSSGDGLGFLPGTKMILFLQIASVTVQLDPCVAPRGDLAENCSCVCPVKEDSFTDGFAPGTSAIHGGRRLFTREQVENPLGATLESLDSCHLRLGLRDGLRYRFFTVCWEMVLAPTSISPRPRL